MGSLSSCPGQATATFFTVCYRAQHISDRHIHLEITSFIEFNDTTLVSFVKKNFYLLKIKLNKYPNMITCGTVTRGIQRATRLPRLVQSKPISV